MDPFSDCVAVKLSVVAIAPKTGLNVSPLSVDTDQDTAGAGNPSAPAVKVATLPAFTVSGAAARVSAGTCRTVRRKVCTASGGVPLAAVSVSG